MDKPYTDYAAYLRRFFPGVKVQKISVNIGSGCPNRNGTIGTGGCIYCNNSSFTPSYCFAADGVSAQLEAGKKFFGRKYPQMKFLAYFQSYTNTYRLPVNRLRDLYEEALSTEAVVGLIVGTRPDCLSAEVVEMLAELNKEKPVFVELGVETLHDRTLSLINRGHTAIRSEEAIRLLSSQGLHVGVHLIAGLPGETVADMLETIDRICRLPVESVKLHHLQVLRRTRLAELVENGRINYRPWILEEYLDFCVKAVERIPRHIAIERFLASAPPEMVIAPKWGLKNYQFTNLLTNKLNTHKK